jgi:hypothetical protein
MLTEAVRGAIQHGQGALTEPDERLEFVRFCYRRRSVVWPELYDEMCAVAARGAYRGMGYAELAEHGICFGLPELPGFVALAQQVMLEEQPRQIPTADVAEAPRTELGLPGLSMAAAPA